MFHHWKHFLLYVHIFAEPRNYVRGALVESAHAISLLSTFDVIALIDAHCVGPNSFNVSGAKVVKRI